MSLSPEIQDRLHQVARNQELYTPREDITRELGNRSLTMVVGPAAVGKTYVMQRVTEIDARFGLSPSISTRDPRPDDMPGLFRYFGRNDTDINTLLKKVLNGDLVNYALHPSELKFYGNELEDFPFEKNLLATLSGAIDDFTARGFGETNVIGLVSAPNDWKKWFDDRYQQSDSIRFARLTEAETSYQDLLARSDVAWVINREGHADEAATDIVHVVDGKRPDGDEALAYAHRILQLVAIEKERAYTESHD